MSSAGAVEVEEEEGTRRSPPLLTSPIAPTMCLPSVTHHELPGSLPSPLASPVAPSLCLPSVTREARPEFPLPPLSPPPLPPLRGSLQQARNRPVCLLFLFFFCNMLATIQYKSVVLSGMDRFFKP